MAFVDGAQLLHRWRIVAAPFPSTDHEEQCRGSASEEISLRMRVSDGGAEALPQRLRQPIAPTATERDDGCGIWPRAPAVNLSRGTHPPPADTIRPGDRTVRASLPGTRRADKFYRSCLHSLAKVHKMLATKPTGEITPLPFTKRCQQRIITAGIARIRERWRN